MLYMAHSTLPPMQVPRRAHLAAELRLARSHSPVDFQWSSLTQRRPAGSALKRHSSPGAIAITVAQSLLHPTFLLVPLWSDMNPHRLPPTTDRPCFESRAGAQSHIATRLPPDGMDEKVPTYSLQGRQTLASDLEEHVSL